MAIYSNKIRPTLPEGYDPYDMTLKVQFNPKADAMNFIHFSRRLPLLACGANAKSKGAPCTRSAGFGTDHVGYGRCKYHGGCSTGPKTPEGKARVGRSRIHGLYAQVLSPQEQEIFESLNSGERKVADLELEIAMLKTKILAYLEGWRKKYTEALEAKGEAAAEKATKVYFNYGEYGAKNVYHAGTIEDNVLDRALNTLGRLVEKHDRLNGGGGSDILDKVNQELRAASFGQVSVAWGSRPAQARKGEGD
ncbi:MAG: hypothetical protein NHB14_20805 [Desulfosporosinus sp.]|nr:hypothetical protein [Desulfosporosinus sp.]